MLSSRQQPLRYCRHTERQEHTHLPANKHGYGAMACQPDLRVEPVRLSSQPLSILALEHYHG